ncbi:uncharacterized protein VTP21DRAFT_11569 [Calcarisporiella thermophila]|uniref:uncharacterized protein n=1 Tax=Calcarisporiella thermophila TaxID=911321 RepID=UPI0037446A05
MSDPISNPPEDGNRPTLSERAKALQKLQQNEQRLKESLELQLGQARQAKAELEASLDTSTFKESAQLGDVTITSEEIKALMKSNDIEEIKAKLRQAYQCLQDQELAIKKLRFELEMEVGHVNILRHDNQMLRQMTVDMHAHAEQEEEYICNKLLKSIAGLKREKGELLVQVEREEEYLTNMLQKKLYQLQKEKVDMENALEQEQEYIVNRLQKQLETLRLQHQSSHSVTGASSSVGVSPTSSQKKFIPAHSPSASISDYGGPSQGVVEMLKAEVNGLRSKVEQMEKEYVSKFNQCNRLKSELIELRKKQGLPISDIQLDESLPSVVRPSVSPRMQTRRSRSTSSSRSISSVDTSLSPSITPIPLGTPFGGSLSLGDSLGSTGYPTPAPGSLPRSRSTSRERSRPPSMTAPLTQRRVSGAGLSYPHPTTDQPRSGQLQSSTNHSGSSSSNTK